ncbi:MAG: hypothetical protein ABEK59_00040 [Halobacteria archaeon]
MVSTRNQSRVEADGKSDLKENRIVTVLKNFVNSYAENCQKFSGTSP